MYLGATLSIMEDDGIQGSGMTSDKYVKVAVENVEQELVRVNQRLPSKCKTPMTVGYCPKRDVSAELTSDGVQRYQELIGVLRWTAELGCVDILLETTMVSTHMALPRKGHMEQVYHVFGYLKTHSNGAYSLTHGTLTLTNVLSAVTSGMISTVTLRSKCQTTCCLHAGVLCPAIVLLMWIMHQTL